MIEVLFGVDEFVHCLHDVLMTGLWIRSTPFLIVIGAYLLKESCLQAYLLERSF
jgi:hypothetical protein